PAGTRFLLLFGCISDTVSSFCEMKFYLKSVIISIAEVLILLKKKGDCHITEIYRGAKCARHKKSPTS
ncbi:MAG TPA: hypothetical protein VK469_02210, partial [Candidatus Kapabacteria bacterium]|nr:hypothetical protein [Candidatus Kapabacteria bacterium]